MRKLGLISSLWAALLFFPLTGFALGLGEIETSSFLNQPLNAEIEVISARPGEIDDLLISLASRDAFRKAGLDRPAVLSKLRFVVDKSEDGKNAKILVTTKIPVKEPFLSFLVEADWAKGRLLREFTVLLDPPSFAQQATEPPQLTAEQPSTSPLAAESAAAAEPMPVQAETESTYRQPIAIADEPTFADQTVYTSDQSTVMAPASDDQVIVEKGDTLWGIASRFKDESHSMAQLMLAMQVMSPEAFGNDNINNLKVGAVLRVPDRDALDRLSKQQAYAQVLEQNGLWDEYVARASGAVSTGSPDTSGVTGSELQEDSQLSLLAPGDGDSQSASLQDEASSGNTGQLRKQLALAEEELEAARLENDDLSSRVRDLEQQLTKFEELQKLVEIEDSSLAQLQDSAKEEAPTDMVASGEIEQQPLEEKPTDEMIQAADEMLAQESSEQMPAQPDDGMMAETEEQMPAMADEQAQMTDADTMIDPAAETIDEMAIQQPLDDSSETVAAPAPVIVTEAPDTTTDGGLQDMLPSMGDLLTDPVMLGGLAAIIALLLGIILFKRKRADKDDDEGISLTGSDDLLDEDATPIHIPTVEGAEPVQEEAPEIEGLDEGLDLEDLDSDSKMTSTVVSEGVEEEDEFARTAKISAEEMPETEAATAVQAEQDDVLNEVDVYLAYGLYDNAEDLLNESLSSSPDRADYRAKLLDTYFATKNKAAFVKEAEVLKTLGGAADRFWDRIQIMGFELAPENDLFSGAKDSDVSVEDLEYAKPDSADFDIGSDDDITDFSSTDFDLGEDSFDVSSTMDLDSLGDDDILATQAMEGLDLDFPDLEEKDEPVTAADSEPQELPGDIGEDLGLDDAIGEDISLDEGLDIVDELEGIEDLATDGGESDFGLDTEVDLDTGIDLDSDSELDLDMGDDIDGGTAEISIDDGIGDKTAEISLDDDLDLSSDDSIVDMVELESDLDDSELNASAEDELVEEVPLDIESGDDINLEETGDAMLEDEDAVELNLEDTDLDDEVSDTMVMPADELAAPADSTVPSDAGLDFDMSDMADSDLQTGSFSPADDSALSDNEKPEDDITEFKPANATGEFDAFLADAETTGGQDKTGTFAPGDFNDEEDSIQVDEGEDITGLEGLMLPDDVDEVGTKLDLAKAFIDMGDAEGARSSLQEVLSEGTAEQQAEATGLLKQIN